MLLLNKNISHLPFWSLCVSTPADTKGIVFSQGLAQGDTAAWDTAENKTGELLPSWTFHSKVGETF